MSDRNTPSNQMNSALDLAILFHDTYERLAPQFGYETRPETRKFSPSSPNGQLMRAVCEELLKALRSPVETTAGMGPRTPDNSMVICPACTCQFHAISVNDQTERRALREHIAWAWSIIASAGGGDWNKESADWREAAGKWERARNPYDGLEGSSPKTT